MSQYRIYLLDHRGHVARAIVQEAESDEAVLRAAAMLDHPHGFEVWDHARRVRPAGTTLPHAAQLAAASQFAGSPDPL